MARRGRKAWAVPRAPLALAVLLSGGAWAQTPAQAQATQTVQAAPTVAAGQGQAGPTEQAAPSAQQAQTAQKTQTAQPSPAPQVAQADGVASVPAAGELPAVVVTGTRAERTLREVPASAQVIDAEALQERQTDDIRELAEDVPNVTVERRSNRMTINTADGRAGNAGFNIRGLDGNRVLMLVDGVRMPRSYSFGASGRDNVDFGLVDRVEVIKGPSSALYGSDGIGGVVQFFTRSPATYLKDGKTLGGQAALAYEGDSRAVRAGATLAGRASDSVQWLLSGSGMRGHALDNRGSDASASPARTAPNPEDTRDLALLGKLVLTPHAGQQHTFTAEHVDRRNEIDILSQQGATTRGVTTLTADGHTKNRRSRLSWQGRFNVDAAWADTVRSTLAYQRLYSLEHYENTRSGAAGQVRDTVDHEKLWQANVQAEKVLRSGALAHKLTYGLDVASTQADNLQTGVTPPAGETFPLKRFPDTRETALGVFVQDEIVGEGWSLIPGLRWDRYRISTDQTGFGGTAVGKSGSAISPRLGATLDVSRQWTLYGQLATGFRTPGADQLNRFFENPIGYYMTVPNPSLKPEKARHVELGAKGQGDNWRLEAAVFYGRYKDFILDNQAVAGTGRPGDPLVFQAVNVGSATISGFEVAGEYRLRQVAGGTLSLPAAFGYARGRDRDTDQPINTIQPARLNLGVRYAQADWSVQLSMTHRWAKKAKDVAVSDPRASAAPFLPGASTTFDLSGQWRLWRHASGDLRLNAAVHNLTNKKYWRWSDVQGLTAGLGTLDAYSQPGRKFSVSLVGSF
ncbi:MAG: TonB-dependent hemoglobin/transferrin/lactoferrin family receptor [Pseudomonadota bacterium]|nr:TonB-dependent hemoglobin/transferrin/lactoferrin family receptor [Pseudomonadota bacterium]